ncbi:efflux RND transporter periplasmic adaptor subunit [Cytophaga sp. FL35]|uniref:efflux RND transporter periplasmic adaptor subunit n=1 Tax=Cytophaga sp. FL35 TaxID=1904456 RepID=UPI00165347DA|nr:efflux RND transporter periplasmic adaptor subunit [Cytophaga sp. FL35]MBC6998019.1 efflux RND transporter periplasmic adaptor subunit [Cytophaga sp. FL35]
MKYKKNIIIGVVCFAILAFLSYSFFKGGNEAVVEVQTVAVKKGGVTTSVTATGTIEPINQVEVGTQVSGVIEKIYVDYNSVVTEGQLIAELDKTNLKAALSQTQASYDNAINQRNYMQNIYERQKTLYDNQVISKSDYEDALYNYETAKSTVTQRLSDLEQARTNLGYANIYSPINGVVLSRDIDEGQTVAASYSTPTLFTIAQDLREMQVEADVDEADIGGVKEGQRVSFTVDAYLGETFEGVVTQVRLDYTESSNVITYTVVIKADNPDLKLKPGLTATVSIYTLELKDVLTIEAKALNFKPTPPQLMAYGKQQGLEFDPAKNSKAPMPIQDGSRVWIYTKDGRIIPKSLQLGASDGVNVQILEGISEGEQLVYNLKSESTEEGASSAGADGSPFMPKPPGANKKK